MVMSAQQREVLESRLSAVRPMLDVMAMNESRLAAPGERAAAIARPQRAPNGRRHDALLAPDVERRAALVLDNGDQASIAREPLDRLDRQVGSAGTSTEGFGVDMEDDLVVIVGGARALSGLLASEIRLGNRNERIGLLCSPSTCRDLAIRRELDAGRNVARRDGVVERVHDDFSVLDR